MSQIYDTSSKNMHVEYVLGSVGVNNVVNQEQYIIISDFDTENDIISFDSTSNADARVTTQGNLIATSRAKSYSMTISHIDNQDSRRLKKFIDDLDLRISSLSIVNRLDGRRTTYYNGVCIESTSPNIGGQATGLLQFKFLLSRKSESLI
ncbi:MAG: hypothetical protein EBX50_01435 [Chitinophagia bacterium]|nr:hypothetical protein [Chitinophagia bacterium]